MELACQLFPNARLHGIVKFRLAHVRQGLKGHFTGLLPTLSYRLARSDALCEGIHALIRILRGLARVSRRLRHAIDELCWILSRGVCLCNQAQFVVSYGGFDLLRPIPQSRVFRSPAAPYEAIGAIKVLRLLPELVSLLRTPINKLG